MATPASLIKAILVGRPKASERLEHERLSKKLALAVFSSDALSSSAYATEEILLVLAIGGLAALQRAIPVALAITLVLLTVVFSYRQTVHAYPMGGGSYIVARENLGKYPGLVAAAAILTDYVLTVAVSISAGIFAVVSAFPRLHEYRVWMALAVIALISLLNLRGLRESGRIFAVPTYAFIALIATTIVWGLIQYYAFGKRVSPTPISNEIQPLTVFLLLRAFSNGCTALTGVEAIADGVGAFEKPEARNAAQTLTAMAGILAFMFIGLTALASLYQVHSPSENPHRTVVALIALRIYGQGSPLFYAVQAATALILVLAANTAYSDFPRLSAILARDRFAPRQMMTRGDRLSYSNGILALGALAGLLVIAYRAEYTRIINMYVVGVFTAFTLSQAGMVQRWRERRGSESRWRRYALINGFGAASTLVVLGIVIQSKFLAGAWIVMVAIPLLVLWFDTVNRHYRRFGVTLRDPARRPMRVDKHHVVLLVGWPSAEERRALAYADLVGPERLHCVHFSKPGEMRDIVLRWGSVMEKATSLEIVPSRGSLAGDVGAYLDELRARIPPSEFLTVVVPEVIRSGITGLVQGRSTFLVKASLLFKPDVIVTDVVVQQDEVGVPDLVVKRHVVLVLVSGVHNATMLALQYANSLSAHEVRAVHVAIDPGESAKVVREWSAWAPGRELELIDSPYRELAGPLKDYVRGLTASPGALVTILIPEFIVTKWWHNLLHNQTALALKRTFLYEPDVVVTSVPYSLRGAG